VKRSVFQQIVAGYPLDLHGVHGIHHWARVFENGRKLAALTEADTCVVDLFSVFHDSRRKNEDGDPNHGRRGAQLARRFHESGHLDLSSVQLEQLIYACKHHTGGATEADPTVQTCWDADRLDLGRVWVTPDPRYLCTTAAKDPAMIAWADERSRKGIRSNVLEEWLR
jgi:uncharacterized protein